MESTLVAVSPSHRILALMRRLRAMNDVDYLMHLVAYHAAPTLQGLKPATLLCPGAAGRDLDAALPEVGTHLSAAFGVEVTELRNRCGALLLLIHQPALLREALASGEAAGLLAEEGYEAGAADMEQLLAKLRQRCRARDFPHEIGLFLGYPPGDVRRFMREGGHGGRAEGCWRAYDNHAEAHRCSRRYRSAKQRAAELIVGGADLSEMAVALGIGAA